MNLTDRHGPALSCPACQWLVQSHLKFSQTHLQASESSTGCSQCCASVSTTAALDFPAWESTGPATPPGLFLLHLWFFDHNIPAFFLITSAFFKFDQHPWAWTIIRPLYSRIRYISAFPPARPPAIWKTVPVLYPWMSWDIPTCWLSFYKSGSLSS